MKCSMNTVYFTCSQSAGRKSNLKNTTKQMYSFLHNNIQRADLNGGIQERGKKNSCPLNGRWTERAANVM